MQNNSLFITRLAVLLALTLVFQMIGLPQPVTGPVINALLLLACALFGPWTALVLGFLTPLAALVRGQLPLPLWPLAPCVAAANGVLIVAFHAIRRGFRTGSGNGRWITAFVSILLPALIKFGFLAFCARWLVPRLLGHALPPALVIAFTAPQFFTALAGGLLALGMMKIIRKQP
jgi:uncharacterized membrane protein